MSRASIDIASPLTLAEQWRHLVHAADVYSLRSRSGRTKIGGIAHTAEYLAAMAEEYFRAMGIGPTHVEVLEAVDEGVFVPRWALESALELEEKGLLVGVTAGTAPGVWMLTEAGAEALVEAQRRREAA